MSHQLFAACKQALPPSVLKTASRGRSEPQNTWPGPVGVPYANPLIPSRTSLVITSLPSSQSLPRYIVTFHIINETKEGQDLPAYS